MCIRLGIVVALLVLVLLLAPSASAPRPNRPPVATATQSVAVKDDKLPVRTESYKPLFAVSAAQESPLPEPAVEAPPKSGPSLAAEPLPARATSAPLRVAHDICRGRGRTYYNAGRSWRCNRG
jgi:hypothetical protein